MVAEKIATNVRAVLGEARQKGIMPREAALTLARSRVERAMTYQRWHA